MRCSFAYDKKQVIQALRYHFVSRLEIRLLIIAVNLFALGSLLAYVWVKISPFAFLLSSCLWLLLMIVIWWGMPWLVYRQTRAFQHAFTMQFHEAGFELEHEGRGKTWNWEQLHRWTETPHFFHLYFDPRSFWLVPKEDLSDEDRLQLRGWLRSGVKA